jgi:formylmethanofuran dehydrogenase subunit E
VIRNFSPSHGNLKAKTFLVDPVTGEAITFESDSVKTKKFLSSQSGEKLRNEESALNTALNGEIDTKAFLPEEKGKEKAIFQFRRVASAETCEFCGENLVEYEVNDLQSQELLFRCSPCFEKLRARFSNAVWKEIP